MSIKINFVRGDEILTTTMSVGRTMLDAAKKLKIPEIPAICNGSCNCGTCHVHIDPEWVDKIEPMDPGSMELFMLERSTTLTKTEVGYVVRWIYMMFMRA